MLRRSSAQVYEITEKAHLDEALLKAHSRNPALWIIYYLSSSFSPPSTEERGKLRAKSKRHFFSSKRNTELMMIAINDNNRNSSGLGFRSGIADNKTLQW